MFFFLVQTEQGDIFKVTLETDEDIVSAILVLVIIDGGYIAILNWDRLVFIIVSRGCDIYK